MTQLLSNKMGILWGFLLCININALEITPERLQKDKELICEHIFVLVKKEIETSEKWFVKKTYAYLAQVSEKVYNSRPLPFYDHIEEAKKIFEKEINKPKIAQYIHDDVINFLDEKNGEVNHENLGSYYHNILVDNMKFEEVKKEEFKKNPLAMNEFIKTADDSSRKRYIKNNVHNFIGHFYLTNFYKK